MCVSSNSSLVLFLTGTMCSLSLAYQKNDIRFLTYATVSLMQLAEYLMWLDVENKGQHPGLNIVGNYIGIISLFLQTSLLNVLLPITTSGTYLVVFNAIIYTIMAYNYSRSELPSTKEKSNKLSWGFMQANNKYFITLLFAIFIISQTHTSLTHFDSLEYAAVNLMILLLSMKITTPFVIDFSSLWCYMGATCVVLYTTYRLVYT